MTNKDSQEDNKEFSIKNPVQKPTVKFLQVYSWWFMISMYFFIYD